MILDIIISRETILGKNYNELTYFQNLYLALLYHIIL